MQGVLKLGFFLYLYFLNAEFLALEKFQQLYQYDYTRIV